MLRLGIAGTPEDVVERCNALIEHGATHLSFGPPLGADPLRAVGLLGQRVIPQLRPAVPGWRRCRLAKDRRRPIDPRPRWTLGGQ